jgi:FixJ family two-component response regulator
MILDIRLPGMSELGFQHRLAEAKIHIPIIFITGPRGYPDDRARPEGTRRRVPAQTVNDQDLIDAIHQALERDRMRRQQAAEIATSRERFESLTPRERQVLPWVISGLLNQQIAAEIGTKEATVKWMVSASRGLPMALRCRRERGR